MNTMSKNIRVIVILKMKNLNFVPSRELFFVQAGVDRRLRRYAATSTSCDILGQDVSSRNDWTY